VNRRTVTIAALTLTTLAPTACGSTKDPNPQVADLPTTAPATNGAAAPPSAGADTAGRPRLRIDMTDAELQAMYAPRERCLKKQPGLHDKSDPEKYDASLKAAHEACLRFEPLPPTQLDSANPQAREFIGRVVTCMQEKGFQASAKLDPEAGQWLVKSSNDDQIISSEKPEAACMKQVAGKN
jgi:hypothetical protein